MFAPAKSHDNAARQRSERNSRAINRTKHTKCLYSRIPLRSMAWLIAFSLFLAATVCFAITSNSSYPLSVGADNRHFALSDGTPFFWQADTAWALFHRFNLSDAELYLDDRASKGFNMVLSVGLTQFG